MQRLKAFTLLIVATALTVYAMIVGRSILLPLVVAICVWYLINMLAASYRRIPYLRLPAVVSLSAAVLTFLALSWFLVEMIGGNLAAISQAAPAYGQKLDAALASIYATFDLGPPTTIERLLQRLDVASLAATTATALAEVAGNVGIILVYVLFLLLEQGSFDRKLQALVPDADRLTAVRELQQRIADDIQTYLRIKTLLSLIIGVVGYLVLWVLEVDFAGFFAALFFLFNFIPTVGWLISLAAAALLTFLQFDDLAPLIIVVLGVGGLQLTMNNLVEPAMMGRSLNLSPFIIILALVVFGTIWGLVGMFLCVPILVILMIVLAHFPRTRGLAVLLSSRGEIVVR